MFSKKCLENHMKIAWKACQLICKNQVFNFDWFVFAEPVSITKLLVALVLVVVDPSSSHIPNRYSYGLYTLNLTYLDTPVPNWLSR